MTDPAGERRPIRPNGTRPIRPIFVLIATALLVTVGAYVIFVLTARGQVIDNVAFQGRKATDLAARRAATAVMRVSTPPAVLLGCLAILVGAGRRRQWWSGAVASASVGVALGVTRALKLVLSRPNLVHIEYTHPENTFPSGHSTAVMALALAWIWIAHRTSRDAHVMACVAGVVAWVTAMVGSGWHRPSDVLGGLALAAVVVPVMCLPVSKFSGAQSTSVNDGPERVSPGRVPLGRVAWAAGAAVLASAVFVVAIRNPISNPRHSLSAYLGLLAVCTCWSAGTLTLWWWWGTDSSTTPATVLRSHPPSD